MRFIYLKKKQLKKNRIRQETLHNYKMIRTMNNTYKNLRNQQRDAEALKDEMKNMAGEEDCKHK